MNEKNHLESATNIKTEKTLQIRNINSQLEELPHNLLFTITQRTEITNSVNNNM